MCSHASDFGCTVLEGEAEAFGLTNICVTWKTDPSLATGWTPTLFLMAGRIPRLSCE